MKQCPKCQANISDTAKFCVECGCNIKKYEEEHAQPKARFCPECGTEIQGGAFCPECGYRLGNDLHSETVSATLDPFADSWLSDLESSSNADVAAMKAQTSKEQREKAFAAFEYEEHTDGTYTVTALKDKHALNITVPEGVVAIAEHSFEGCNAIKITLPDTILQIGNCAFKGCQNLTEINLSNRLMIVGDEAFAECELLNIELPASVRRVGKDALKKSPQEKKKRPEEHKKEAEAKQPVPTVEKRKIDNLEVGGNLMFGSYFKDTDGSKSPIEWIVLERNGNKALLISKYGIDCKPYNTDSSDTDWKTSSLRRWLNDEFIKNAFSTAEQQKIQSTKISTSNDTLYQKGNTTTETIDKIFVLSIDEANRYFASNDERKFAPTAYAVSKGAYKNKKRCSYGWLRVSSGFRMGRWVPITAVGGGIDGSFTYIESTDVSVRPAMWVDISKF